MKENKFNYCGYLVIITEDSIYNNFHFKIKTLDEKYVIAKNNHFLASYEAAEIAAREFINELD